MERDREGEIITHAEKDKIIGESKTEGKMYIVHCTVVTYGVR